ncbi:TPA: SGNH/GDSL hydrolase family protein [Providencia stuartii]|uniref:SGNH/GDSL hydrolase family protein n=1 Tax=Providencia sp. PROV261 TaxID=2949949 RepID=UPI00234B53BE|nr:SGNH/GDSL hydrolase family protein [Providencia sp. PROV261]
MTQYNTKNPVGSASPKDVNDNAITLDNLINSTDITTKDRLGNDRLTIKGLEESAVSSGPTVEAAVNAWEQANLAREAAENVIQESEENINAIKNAADTALDSSNQASKYANDAALSASAASASTGKLYANLADANAAISNGEIKSGEYFYIISPSDADFIDLYKNESGAQAVGKSMPSTAALFDLAVLANAKVSINQKTNSIVVDGDTALFFQRKAVTIPRQTVSYPQGVNNRNGYLYYDPVSKKIGVTVDNALPPAGLPVIAIILSNAIYINSASNDFEFIVSNGTAGAVYGKSMPKDALASILDGGLITINLKDKLISTHPNSNTVVAHSTGYTNLKMGQSVSFSVTSNDALIYVCMNSAGDLVAISAPNTPVNVIPIAYVYKQKLTVDAPFNNIELINASGEVAYQAAGYNYGTAQLLEDGKITINLQTKTVECVGTELVLLSGAYVGLKKKQVISFTQQNDNILTWVYVDKNGVLGATDARKSASQFIIVAVVYKQKLYANAPFNNIELYDTNGYLVQKSQSLKFDEIKHRLLLPSTLYLLESEPLALYKESMLSAYQRDMINTLTLQYELNAQIASIDGTTKITSANNGNLSVTMMHDSNMNVRYTQTMELKVAKSDSLQGKTLKYLAFGDSLTEGGMVVSIAEAVRKLGGSLVPVGTYVSSANNNLRCEGRGYWNYRNFIGKSTRSEGVGAHTLAPAGAATVTKFANPVLKLATQEDKTNHPDWCFRFTGAASELSYAEDSNKAGDFYLFDFARYMNEHSVDAPDIITIALSTNDINLDRAAYSHADRIKYCRLGLDIMVRQIKKALPNVTIGIIPAPAWSLTENGGVRWQEETSEWIDVCMNDVRALSSEFNNLYIVPVWVSMDKYSTYPYATQTNLTATSNVKKSTITDWVHFASNGRLQYSSCVANWIANALS